MIASNDTDAQNPNLNTASGEEDHAFYYSFGDPEPVLGNDITSALGCFYSSFNDYYEPPISFHGLNQMTFANPYHSTSLFFKRNQMAMQLKPNSLLGLADFNRMALDYLTFGNAFIQVIRNHVGQAIKLKHVAALNMRRGKNGRYMQVTQDLKQPIKFKPGEILQAMNYNTGQSLYGVPEWYSGMHSALLNTEATLFRRRYYLNGAHVGFILYMNDPNMSEADKKNISEQLRKGKGIGNFRSLLVNIPNGNEKAIQILKVGEINQKDEFQCIKNITADDVIVAHRVPPALAGVKPTNTGGFGDIEKISAVYQQNEVLPMCLPFLELNQSLRGPQRIQFKFESA
jgi:PBSX family phage portal protein